MLNQYCSAAISLVVFTKLHLFIKDRENTIVPLGILALPTLWTIRLKPWWPDEVADVMVNMEVDKVADMMVNMEVGKVEDMVVKIPNEDFADVSLTIGEMTDRSRPPDRQRD